MIMTRLSYSQIFLLTSKLTLVTSYLWAEQPNAWRTSLPRMLDSALKGLGEMDEEFSLKFWHYALRRVEEEPPPSVDLIPSTTLFERLAVHPPVPQHHMIEIEPTRLHADAAPATPVMKEDQKSDKIPSSADGAEARPSVPIVRQTESKPQEIEYPGVIRACQLYFNKVYSRKLVNPEPDEMSWVSQTWDHIKTSIPYLILSRTIVNYGIKLNKEELARYVKFCSGLREWIAEYRGLEGRVARMTMRVDHTSYLLSAIVMSEFEVENVFKEVEGKIGKFEGIGDEHQRETWSKGWLKIVQEHFQITYTSQPVQNILNDRSRIMSIEAFKSLHLESIQLLKLKRQIFNVVIGEEPIGRISDSMNRLESLGLDFIPNFNQAFRHLQSLPVTLPNRERFLESILVKSDWRLDGLLRNPSRTSPDHHDHEIQPVLHLNEIA
ncbi:hypothetical protein DFH28DRAFT_885484 [Melampsora americana]|nr:hypothetical protein DFH28DRAFT_885484 [Melampsora americana]